MENIFFPYSSAYEQTPDILTDMFADVGITMTGGAADYTEFNSQWVGRQLKDVSTAGWGTIGFDAENYFYNSMHSTAPGNRWRFNDPKIDELTEAQQVELDPDARKAIFQEIWTYGAGEGLPPGHRRRRRLLCLPAVVARHPLRRCALHDEHLPGLGRHHRRRLDRQVAGAPSGTREHTREPANWPAPCLCLPRTAHLAGSRRVDALA